VRALAPIFLLASLHLFQRSLPLFHNPPSLFVSPIIHLPPFFILYPQRERVHAEQRGGVTSATRSPKGPARHPVPGSPSLQAPSRPARLNETVKIANGSMFSPQPPMRARDASSPVIHRALHISDRPDSRAVVVLTDPPVTRAGAIGRELSAPPHAVKEPRRILSGIPREESTRAEEQVPPADALEVIKKKRSTLVEEMRERSARKRQESKVILSLHMCLKVCHEFPLGGGATLLLPMLFPFLQRSRARSRCMRYSNTSCCKLSKHHLKKRHCAIKKYQRVRVFDTPLLGWEES